MFIALSFCLCHLVFSLLMPDAWESALRSLRGGKAVPAGQPAIDVWKRETRVVAKALSRISIAALCGDEPYVPEEWSEMQFAWLPKVGKSPSSPSNLRSIGLMAADTKGMLVILREAVKPVIVQYMFDAPQYAYRPGASTADALLRASYHCSSVRALLSQHQRDHTSKILGVGDVDLVGGMMISIDLRKAFDSVSHAELYLSMLEASVPQDLASVIHVQTQCSVLHGGARESNGMSRGLRQGCPVAPILFAAWSVRTLRLFREALPQGSDRDCYTMFADDLLGCWEFHSIADFFSSLRDVRTVFLVLAGLGMEINFRKSVAVLRLRGSAVARVSRHALVWRADGQYLRVRSDPQDFYIPVASTMPYLGAILAYDNYELKTFRNRAQCAQMRFQELRKVLRSNGALSARHRLRLYKATVWPSLWYSLSSIGVTGEVLRGVISVLSGHLRKVLRIYEGGITNQAVMERAGMIPQQFFTAQAELKAGSIDADPFRSAVPLSSCSLVRVGVNEALHSLFGLPFWMREPDMLKVISEEEQRHPPTPPDGAAAQDTLQEAVGRALTDPSKIKKHWQDSHATEWRAAAQEAVPAAYKQFKPELTSIGRHLTFKQSKSSQEQGDSATSTANTGNDWVGRIVLQNSNNLCYLNALRRIGALGMSASRGVLLTAQLQVARHQEGSKSFVPVWPDSEVRLPFFGSELAVEWLRYKVMAVVEHHGEQVSSGHYRAVLRGLSDWLHTDDGVSATVVSFDRDRAELSYLFWAVKAQESEVSEAPDANMLEGEQEWDFYTKYWPSGPGIPAGKDVAAEMARLCGERWVRPSGSQGHSGGVSSGTFHRSGAAEVAVEVAGVDGVDRATGMAAGLRGARTGVADGDEWSLRKGVEDLKYAVSLMQRLMLRHEDASILARIESSFVLHFKLNVPASVAPMLFTSAVAWRKIKAEEPQRLDRPMRCTLLVCLFAELKERMTKVVQEPERLEEMARMGWLAVGPPVVWHFMRWDAAKLTIFARTKAPARISSLRLYN
ncbi:unnamed protein product [Symbiodinium necroappetens]|uniref:Reverse transcriptase domain-containing protein n=1 Tax=Symbiodinium necroappetens TaxID=1628268 RepID=A0A812U9J8_9DINO|nr:unnamed protein product [Symbiodinium necroappetens]